MLSSVGCIQLCQCYPPVWCGGRLATWHYLDTFLFLFIFHFLKRGFLCAVLAVLGVALYIRLALSSEIHLLLPPKYWD